MRSFDVKFFSALSSLGKKTIGGILSNICLLQLVDVSKDFANWERENVC